MHVEQAVFGSSKHSSVSGYHLISKSAGIDRSAGQVLCRWSPTQFQPEPEHRWSINSYPVSEDCVAVARTFLAGPEYSRRGGSQVITTSLLLSAEQFEAYGCNAMSVASTAMALGYLKLPIDMTPATLEPATLPRRPLPTAAVEHGESVDDLVAKATDLLRQSTRIAVVGSEDPARLALRLVRELPAKLKRRFSFTTGLTPAIRRPFGLHFLRTIDPQTRRTLQSQQIVVVNA